MPRSNGILFTFLACSKPDWNKDRKSATVGAVFRRDYAGALGDTAATFLSFVYPGALLAFLIAIGGLESGRVYLIILFLAIWAADTGAYFAGKAFGRHALAPGISPKKSIEGHRPC